MVRFLKMAVFSAISTLVSIAVVSQSLAETLVIQGSTTFARRIEPYKSMVEAFSKHELTLIPNKTVPGLVALIEGRAHMAMTFAPLKNEIEVLLPACRLRRLPRVLSCWSGGAVGGEAVALLQTRKAAQHDAIAIP